MITLLVIFVIILLIGFFFTIKYLLKLRKELNLSVEKLWENKKENYHKEILELNNRKDELLEDYNKNKNEIEKEIKEKQTFNSSLLKIREEELDRLIEEKRKKKEEILNLQLLKEEKERTELLNASWSTFLSEQEVAKQNKLEEIKKIQGELEDFRIQREAVNQAILREKEIQEKESFYKIDISETDREDIKYGEQLCYVKNVDANDCSEFGYICFKKNCGGLMRTA